MARSCSIFKLICFEENDNSLYIPIVNAPVFWDDPPPPQKKESDSRFPSNFGNQLMLM